MTKEESAYGEKLFEFFSQKDNYQTLLDVYFNADMIFEKLIQNFWKELEEKLKAQYPDSEGWIVTKTQKPPYCKLRVYHERWCNSEKEHQFSIAVEDLHFKQTPFIGINISTKAGSLENNELKKRIIKEINLPELFVNNKNDRWAKHKDLFFNLKDEQYLRKLYFKKLELHKRLVEEYDFLINQFDSVAKEIVSNYEESN